MKKKSIAILLTAFSIITSLGVFSLVRLNNHNAQEASNMHAIVAVNDKAELINETKNAVDTYAKMYARQKQKKKTQQQTEKTAFKKDISTPVTEAAIFPKVPKVGVPKLPKAPIPMPQRPSPV